MENHALQSACVAAFRALNDDLLTHARALGVTVGVQGHLHELFDDDATLKKSALDGIALGQRALFALLTASEKADATRAFSASVLDAATDVDASLVLDVLRHLTKLDDAAALRLALPYLSRRWSGGLAGLVECPVENRAELLIDWVRALVLANEAEPAEYGPLLRSCHEGEDADGQSLIQGFANEMFQGASSARQRSQTARIAASVGDLTAIESLQDSAQPEVWADAFACGLDVDPKRTVLRNGTRLAQDTAPGQLLWALLAELPTVLTCQLPDQGALAVVFIDPERQAMASLAILDVKSGVWGPELALPAALMGDGYGRLTVPKKYASDGVMYLEADTAEGDGVRWYLLARNGELLWSKNQTGLKALLKGAGQSQTRPAPKPKKASKPAPPTKQTTGFHVRQVAQGPQSTSGKVIVSGAPVVALFEGDRLHFAPPEAVAIAVGDSRLVSWRLSKRPDASGVGRGDDDWVVEVFSWSRSERSTPVFERCHRVRSRQVIAWCWPDSLRCPKSKAYRLATLVARSEDETRSIYVIIHDKGHFSETEDKATAMALARSQPLAVDKSKAAALFVEPSER